MTFRWSSYGGRIPLPPEPGGKHSYHFVQDESLQAYEGFLRIAKVREREVLCHVENCGWHGSTNDEGWRLMNCDTPNQYAPVITRLKGMGLVVWRGDHRKTLAGNPAKVWVSARTWVEHHLDLLANGELPLEGGEK